VCSHRLNFKYRFFVLLNLLGREYRGLSFVCILFAFLIAART